MIFSLNILNSNFDISGLFKDLQVYLVVAWQVSWLSFKPLGVFSVYLIYLVFTWSFFGASFATLRIFKCRLILWLRIIASLLLSWGRDKVLRFDHFVSGFLLFIHKNLRNRILVNKHFWKLARIFSCCWCNLYKAPEEPKLLIEFFLIAHNNLAFESASGSGKPNKQQQIYKFYTI